MYNDKSFNVSCPWCGAINQRKTLYWTFGCFYCGQLFYVNGWKKGLKVLKEKGRWDYLDEPKQSWMN